ncbi:MAG: ATP-dependent DNA helicase RecG [Candidatus Eremiobacteraeota bacterium]|nr:ATP-dependent DNA helicase RecG [Candidatus Eremiobacteraeota bacterium]
MAKAAWQCLAQSRQCADAAHDQADARRSGDATTDYAANGGDGRCRRRDWCQARHQHRRADRDGRALGGRQDIHAARLGSRPCPRTRADCRRRDRGGRPLRNENSDDSHGARVDEAVASRKRRVTMLTELAGIGKELAARFEELNVRTPLDLLDHFPFRYDDLRIVTPAANLGRTENEENAVGRIVRVRERRARLPIIEAEIEDDTGRFMATWFGRAYLIGALRQGQRVFVRGRVAKMRGVTAMNVMIHRTLDDRERYRGEIVPVYPATKRLTSRKIRQVIVRNLDRLLSLADDLLPARIAKSFRFAPAIKAYRDIHAPETPEAASAARERFIFTEFLSLALAAQLKRVERETGERAPALKRPENLLGDFQQQLAFALTPAQLRTIDEIWRDMARDAPMNRLLQGDVGSGKTLVAAAAILMAARNGVQSALMAPTEILAAQHAAKLAPLLLPLGITVEAVFGSQTGREREEAKRKLASGEARLAVGTHALLTEGVDFAQLGLVIIDEQHRFGVEQRAKLRAKGLWPHTLHMTATPIPRTLAQSVYADLDLSVLDELPPGRTPIETFTLRRSRLSKAYDFVRLNVQRGAQAYIVAPAIEESETGTTSVTQEYERLRKAEFVDLRVGLLHGRLTAREKDEVMAHFVSGALDVLVSTTVIEVGVDVSNASVMVVLDAHRYGLAQLHQLRGRVGRGAAKSYCLLIAPDEAGEVERLAFLTQSTDGFEIAEEDLRQRGPGQFAGTAQSGLVNFKVADLVRDIDVYRRAKKCAEDIVKRDPKLEAPENRSLAELLEAQPSARAMLASS